MRPTSDENVERRASARRRPLTWRHCGLFAVLLSPTPVVAAMLLGGSIGGGPGFVDPLVFFVFCLPIGATVGAAISASAVVVARLCGATETVRVASMAAAVQGVMALPLVLLLAANLY